MKILIPTGFNVNMLAFLKRAGYASQIHQRTGRLHFIKRLTSGYYPHFHIYIEKDEDGNNYLSLHLDQKGPSYGGFHAHSGEYDSPVVMNEANRLKQYIYETQSVFSAAKVQKKEPFLKRLFGL